MELMEEAISLDLNGKLAMTPRFVRGQVVAARTGWADPDGRVETGDSLHVGIREAA